MSMTTPGPQIPGVDANSYVQQNALFVQHNKQIAADAIASGNANTANSLAATGTLVPTAQAVVNHVQQYNAHSWWANALKGAEDVFTHVINATKAAPIIGKPIGVALDWSAKGLQEVQKDYKFVSSLYDKHGPAAGLLGTLGVVAGGVLGSAFGPEGTVFGADLAGTAERNILGRVIPNWSDSLKDSDNPNYQADLGRQVAHGLANIPGFGALKNTDTGVGQFVSGVLDISFDFKTDPLALLGKFSAGLKSGKYMVEAKNVDGTAMLDAAGKPIYKPSMRIAAQSDSVNNFIVSRTGLATSADQLDKAYAGSARFKNAVDDIAQRTNPIEIQKLYPESRFTTQAAQALAKAKEPGEVLAVLGKTLFSDELATKGSPTAALTLPVRGWAKNFSGNLLENIRKNSQAATIEDTANFLLPKKNPILNADGSQKLDSNGFVMYNSVKPAIISGEFANALAGKVRTFTGMKAVAFNPDLLKQSGKEITWDDPQAGQTVFNVLYTAMPYDMAMEHTANIMLETDPAARSFKFHEAQKETLKAAGLPASTKMLDKILAQGRRATFGDEMQNGIYSYTHDAKALGQMEMKDGSIKTTGIYAWQRAGDAMLDYKQMRMAMRATKAYGSLYNHADDFYTKYTNVIFAPLTLLSAAFGLRVAASEALHQVIRKGFGEYLNNIVVDAAASRAYKLKAAEATTLKDAVAQALTPEEHDALVTSARVVTSPEDVMNTLNFQRELGFTAENNPNLVDSLVNYTNGSGDYSLVNSVLREGYTPTPQEAERASKITKDLDSLISKAPALNKPIVTFRGLSSDRFSKEYIDSLFNLKPGDVFTEKSFSSTDLKPTIADRFTRDKGAVLEITNPAGTKGIFPLGFRTNVDEKFAKGESEWILPRNSKFTVTSIEGNRIKVTLGDGVQETPGMLTDNAVLKDARAKDRSIKQLAKQVQDLGLNKGKINNIVNDFVTSKGRIAPLEWAAYKYYKVAPYSVRDKVDALTRLHLSTGTDGLVGDVNSAHAGSADVNAADRVDMFSQNYGHGLRPGEQLHGLTANDPHYHQYWAVNINKMAKDPIAQAVAADYYKLKSQAKLNNVSDDQLWAQVQERFQKRVEDPTQFTDLRRSLRALDQAKPEAYAAQAVGGIRGLVTGSDGTIHENLIRAIKNGDTVFSKDLLKLPTDQAPKMVLGRLMKPSTENILQRVVEFGYRTAVNPVMNFVSRQPLFAHFFYEQYRQFKPMVEQGLIDDDTALRMAAQNGVKDMLPLIHNPSLRSQFSIMHRNVLPFYFAQEQAMKRVGRLILTNPQAFRDFQMINQGLNNPGFVHTDSSGKKYIVYPVVGEFGNAAVRGLNALGFKQFTGLPESVIGNTASLMTVLPELKVPSVGTFTNITLTELDKMFPWMHPVVNAATGGYPASNFMDAIIPNSTMRDFYNALSMDQRENSVYNSKLSAIASAYYHGDLPENYAQLPPAQQQAIMDRIEHNAQSNLFVKGVLAFFLPLAPGVSNDYYTKAGQSFNSEFRTILTAELAKDKANGYANALSKFIQEHGSNSISYTVTRTTDNLNGVKLPLAQSTLDWLGSNQNLMQQYPSAAGYLIPQVAADKDALKVENKLLAMQLRSKRTPADFMRSLYIQKGWTDIQDNYNSFQDFITKAKASGNRYAMGQAIQSWNTYTANFGISNPIWYEDYTGKSRTVNAKVALVQLQDMQSKGLLKGAQGSKISDVLNNFNNFNAMYQQVTASGNKTAGSNYKSAWFTYLDNLEKSDINLTNVINSVFRRVA